jgi:hypothetical protein
VLLTDDKELSYIDDIGRKEEYAHCFKKDGRNCSLLEVSSEPVKRKVKK